MYPVCVAKHRLSDNHAVFLLTAIAKLGIKLTNKGDMKRTTPFQCFRKPAREAVAASDDTLQTDDRNVNIRIYSK